MKHVSMSIIISAVLAVTGCVTDNGVSKSSTKPTDTKPMESESGRLGKGDAIPAVTLKDSTGADVDISALTENGSLVLAFFPKAFTGGCTSEMKAFRDMHERFAERAAQVYGVSTDTVETQARFKKELELPFQLLSDADHKAAEAFGVLSSSGRAHRVTFVIGSDGKILETFTGSEALDPSGSLEACPLKKNGEGKEG